MTVYPQRLVKPLAELRVHPGELEAAQILPFIPKAAEIDLEKDKRLEMFAKILADCSSIHAAATAVIQLEAWDFMAVYYDAIDHFGHGFMKYHPPRQDHIPEEDFERYKDVVEGGYRFHDMMLQALLALAGDDTTVILISDHGFHPDHLRPSRIPFEPAGPAIEHRPYGIFVMKGPGVKVDERIYGATLLDIAPTLLTLFGLPVGEDMDGKPLVQAFDEPPSFETIPSWEEVEGEAGMHPPDKRIDPVEAQESIKQLVALGYIEDPGENKDEAIRKTVREANYNLAQAYVDANRYVDATAIFKELWKDWPDEIRFANRLTNCYLALERIDEARRIVDEIVVAQVRLAQEAQEKLKEIGEKLAKKKNEKGKDQTDATIQPDDSMDEAKSVASAERGDPRAGDDSANPVDGTADDCLSEKVGSDAPVDEEEAKLTDQEKREIAQLRAQAMSSRFGTDFLKATLLFSEGNHEGALEFLLAAEKAEPRMPNLHIQIGNTFCRMKRWEDAHRAFGKALEIDPESAQAHLGMCRCLLPRKQNLEAADEALTAVGLLYHYPQAHFNLGVALHRIGYVDRAIEALNVALTQSPNFAEAHQRLAYIHKHRLKDEETGAYHRRLARAIRKERRDARKKRRDERDARAEELLSPTTEVAEVQQPAMVSAVDPEETITIVSGLPRSGTSMMMQMLGAGGLECVTDKEREADTDNPRGYLEDERVKQLRRDASWLGEAKGKAIKIIAQLLRFLPAEWHYRVIFVEREIDEVLASQAKMLEHRDQKGGNLSDQRLKAVFTNQVRQVKIHLANQKIPTLYISHRDALGDPPGVASRANAFLGGALNESAMIGVVDPKLYRQRK